MALLLVVAVVAMAAVLGFALLSGATLQTRAAGNANHAAQADYLAESGINLAVHYLQHPEKAPSLNAGGYWSGTGGDLAIGSEGAMAINVSVARDATDVWTYEINSTGKVGPAGERQITRTGFSRATVVSEYQLKYATAATAALTLYPRTTITGDVLSNNGVTLKVGAQVTGNALTPLLSLDVGYLNPPANPPVPSNTVGAPAVGDVNKYATYAYQGGTGTADTIPAGVTSLPNVLAPMVPSAANTANVWVSEGNMTLNNNVVIPGTLVVKGNLTINGLGIVITPKAGMPGVIVTNTLQVNQPKKVATISGVVYVGVTLKSNGVPLLPADASILNINGGLLLGGAVTPITNNYNVVTNVKLDPNFSKAPDLSTTGRVPVGVNLVRWGPTVSAPY